MRKLIKLFATLTFLVFLAGCVHQVAVSDETADPIKIGFIGPLTGDAVSYGEPMKGATDLAINEINNTGGINGRQLEIIYEDGRCTGKDATNAAHKLIDIDKVKVIIGGLCSGETMSIAPIAEKAKIILFSAGSGSPDITNAGDYIFRNFPSDASSGKKMAEVAMDRGFEKVALLIESTDYAQAVKRVFVNRFEELGGEILIDEGFISTSTNLRTEITKIKAANADAIYFVPQTLAKGEIGIRQMQELKLDIQLLSNEMIAAKSIIENDKFNIEGAIYAEPSFDENNPLTKKFLDKYKEQYLEMPKDLPPVYLATAYDAVYILAEQIEKYGEDTDKIKAGLYDIKGREGAAGILTIDDNGDPMFEYIVKIIRDGKAEILKQ